MKTKMYILLALITFACLGVEAQNQQSGESKNKVKITVKTTENGKTNTITKEVESDANVDVDSLLRDMGVMDGMDINAKGQRVEVDIKKKSGGAGEDKDVNVNVFAPNAFRYSYTDSDDSVESESRPFLGVYINDLSADKAKELGLKNAKGAYINQVIEGTGAEKAGIQQGEVITKFNGRPVNDYEELIDMVRQQKPGGKVEVELYKDGHFRTVTVELGEKKTEKRISTPFGNFNWNQEDFDKSMEELREHLKDMGANLNDSNFNFNFNFNGPGQAYHWDMNSNQAFLGIVPGDITGNGVKIGKVLDGSTAAEMGLKNGDVINEVNNQEIKDFDDLVKVLHGLKPGDEVSVKFDRNGQSMSESGTLKSRADVMPRMDMFKGNNNGNDEHLDKEVKVEIEIEDLTDKDAQELSSAGVDVKVDSDLQIKSLQFAPNPNDGKFNLSFELAKTGDTEVKVYDETGRQVYYEMLKNLSGKYSNDIDISGEPSGIYFLIISQNGNQFSKKIVKQ